VGACDERVIDLVLAKDCDEAEAQVAKAAQHAGMLRELLLKLVSSMPEPSAAIPPDWAETQQTIQRQARAVALAQ